MTTKQDFADMLLNTDLTDVQRVAKISVALDALLPERNLQSDKVRYLAAYFDFKREYHTAVQGLNETFKRLNSSTLAADVKALAADIDVAGMAADAGDNSLLRVKIVTLARQLAEEKAAHDDMLSPNARLRKIYTILEEAEGKARKLPMIIREESRRMIRDLSDQGDVRFPAQHYHEAGKTLYEASFMLDAIASYQQSETEKQILREHLKTRLVTGVPVTAPKTARFRKMQVMP